MVAAVAGTIVQRRSARAGLHRQFGSRGRLFVIERGAPSVDELDHESTVDRLIWKTDDTYGFPPFRVLRRCPY
jgi:hypothetical protein